MIDENSVTQWIDRLKTGDELAANLIWSRYVAKLIRIAHARLASSRKRVADEEDVVVNAFAAFFRGVEGGRFSQLSDRNDLWQILVMLTERHAIDQQRAERAQKRGGGQTRGDSVFGGKSGSGILGFEQMEDAAPTPAFAIQTTEELQLLLSKLENPLLEQVALRKLEGFTNREIAEEIDVAISTIERKLKTIRGIWIEEASDEARSSQRLV